MTPKVFTGRKEPKGMAADKIPSRAAMLSLATLFGTFGEALFRLYGEQRPL